MLDVTLNPELEEYVARKIERGHYKDASAVIRESLRIWKEQHDRRVIRRERIDEIVPMDSLLGDAGSFFNGSSIEELARMQGVGPIADSSILAGGWPDDEDVEEFIAETTATDREKGWTCCITSVDRWLTSRLH